MPDIDWVELFAFSMSPLELFIRGSATYIFLFLVFRFILKRDVGAVGIADILVLVIIADASQNAMSGEYKSVSDGFVLVATLTGWNCLFNYLSYRFPVFRRLAEADPLCLIENGRKLQRNMRREYITDEELESKLREKGVENLRNVKRAYMESDGQISIVLFDAK